MAGGTRNMRKHLQLRTGKSVFQWSERGSEYKKKKVCDREKKTDVFSEKGRVNEERTPRVPPCPPPTSLHVGYFCMSNSVIPGGQNGLLSLHLALPRCVSHPFSPHLPSRYVCAVSTLIQLRSALDYRLELLAGAKRIMVIMKMTNANFENLHYAKKEAACAAHQPLLLGTISQNR